MDSGANIECRCVSKCHIPKRDKSIWGFWITYFQEDGLKEKGQIFPNLNIKIMGVQKLGIAIGTHLKYLYTLCNTGLANKCPLGTKKKTKN